MMDPIGYPDISRFRLMDMFTACTNVDVKEDIVKSFTQPEGRRRIIVATVAFGMGIDCSNVQRIIHWGPPSDVEVMCRRLDEKDKMDRYLMLYCIFPTKILD